MAEQLSSKDSFPDVPNPLFWMSQNRSKVMLIW